MLPMATKRGRYRNTLSILIISFIIGIAFAAISERWATIGVIVIGSGWFVVAPLYFVWYSRQSSADEIGTDPMNDPTITDPITTLKRQYLSGELSDSEFERRAALLDDDDYWQFIFETTAEADGIPLDNTVLDSDQFVIEYTPHGRPGDVLLTDIGTFVGGYSTIIEAGYARERMIVRLYERDGTEAGSYDIKSNWIQSWVDGEMTGDELFDLILDTVEINQ